MVQVSEAYKWEAETNDGKIISKGGDLSNCKRFSLLPQIDVPQHDFVGIPMLRRFSRVFHKVRFAERNDIPGGLRWENESNILGAFEDLTKIIKPGYLIRQNGPEDICPWCKVVEIGESLILIDQPYQGRSAPKCNSRFALPSLPSEHMHCVVCKGFRVYVKSSNGSILVTPEDYELYL